MVPLAKKPLHVCIQSVSLGVSLGDCKAGQDVGDVEWIGVQKPVGDLVQWHVLPTDFDSLLSGQVFFAQYSSGHHDKHRKETLHVGEKKAKLTDCFMLSYGTTFGKLDTLFNSL